MGTAGLDLELVILAGGSGTRFWPKSTSSRPKQFLSFTSDGRSLLQLTAERFSGLVSPERVRVLTTKKLGPLVREQLGASAAIMEEPVGRNTAPCIYWAARVIADRSPQTIMMVMPSDHFIARPDQFKQTVESAARRARESGELITLGVMPSRPETGYGYLKISGEVGTGCRRVDAFVEKPDLKRAEEFVKSGNYLWNGGMFIWRADAILSAFDRFMPELARAWEKSGKNIDRAYPEMTATSIDFGVMEKAQNVVTYPLDCGWDDLGSWISLEDLERRTGARSHEDAVLVAGDLVSVESSGNIVDARGSLVALLGIKDTIVVRSGESILIAKKEKAQDIRKIVEAVKQRRPDLA